MSSELRVDKIIPTGGVPTGGGGGIVQVKMGVTTGQTTTTSGNFDATALQVTITPKFSTSKIFIMCSGGMNGPAGGGSSGESIGYKIYRSIGGGSFAETESSTRGQAAYYGAANNYNPLSINYLDSPSTTSAVTYKLYQKRLSGSGTPSLNRDSNNQTQMIAMEVSA
tara:strand:- start:29 stop:529 length:501 start_codon:yes stop_codon:yes gene_type:complete